MMWNIHLTDEQLRALLGEFDFRYNNRKMSDKDRAMIALKGVAGKRLYYRATSNA